jgi:D-xylose transport system permease protein
VVDLTAAPDVAAVQVPPEVLAQSLREYLRGWWLRVSSGNSGVLPVVLAIVLVAVVFEIVTPEHAFLRPSNLVYIFGLSTVYMVLAMAEIVVLLLGEIDLSVGAVALLGGVIAFKLVQLPGPGWPWWAAILAAVVCCGVIGALQGTLIARLKIPSFIVSLGGFLLYSGVLVIVLGGADGFVTVSSSVPNQRVIYYLVQGVIDPVAGWVALAVVVGAVGTALWLRGAARRHQGLEAPPVGLTAIRIALVALVGVAVVVICSVNRNTSVVPVEGVPWVIPIVLVVLGAWTLLLGRTRFGRYVYAIGGNPEGEASRGQSGCHPHLGFRPLLGDRRPRRHPARFLLLRSVQHQHRRPRFARPLYGRRRRHRRDQPLRRQGQSNPRRSRRAPHRRYRVRRVPSRIGGIGNAARIHRAGRRAPGRGAG